MTLLTGETDVFSSQPQNETRCVVAFLARRQNEPEAWTSQDTNRVMQVLDELKEEGWLLSIRAMFSSGSNSEAMAMDSGFSHPWDVSGAFEAPDIDAAISGTVRLEKAGWAKRFITEWLIGPREFATVNGIGPETERNWAFLAFWEWNDAWCEATPAQRQEYDAECDVAFKGDLAFNVNIAGRHRLDWAHNWHHLGIWEIASPDVADQAITGHEHAADFKFTTSRHVIGKVRPITELLSSRY